MERALPEVVLADCPAAWFWALFSGEFWAGLFCEAPGTRPQLAVNPVSSIKVMQNTNFLFIWPRSMPRGTEACAQSIKKPKKRSYTYQCNNKRTGALRVRQATIQRLLTGLCTLFQTIGTKFESLRKWGMCSNLLMTLQEVCIE